MSNLNTSSSRISSPELFDHTLRCLRAGRYDADNDFLGRYVESSLLDRLSFIKRTFSHVLLTGSCGPGVEVLLQEMGYSGIQNKSQTFSDVLVELEGQNPRWAMHDLILSNLNLQWVNDLPGMLWQIRNLLKPDGLFIGALLGGDTLCELKASFLQAEMELYGGASPRVVPMIDLYSSSQLLLRAGFKLPVADRDTLTVTYPNLRKLVTDLRAMGQTNVMFSRHKGVASRRLFQRVEEIYRERFSNPDGKMIATFEVIYLTGWAYHESQQQPLLPGSAKVSLAKGLS